MNQTWRYAVLFALLLTAPLCLVGALWAWFNGYTYPEGLVERWLVTWAFLFAVVTAGVMWDNRRRR
jgi:hypothetical protein